MGTRTANNILTLLCALHIGACGVKGDPLPPEEAPKLGRGHPTYSKAATTIELENQKITEPQEEEESDDEKL